MDLDNNGESIMRFTAKLLAASALTAIAIPAHAQDADVDALKAEIAELKAALEILSSKVEAQSQQNTQTQNDVAAVKTTAIQAKTAADTAQATAEKTAEVPFDISWKGAPEIKGDGGWSFKPRGRILWDVGTVDAPNGVNDPGLGFSNEFRRVRLGVQGKIPGGFGYKLEGDAAGGGFELTDAYLDYKKDGLTITVGQHNNFQSLEELSSSNDTSFIERSAFTDAFNFARRIGLSAQVSSGDLIVQGGFFTDNGGDLDDDENNSISLDGRVVYAPKLGDAQLHLGASAHWRDFGEAITTARFRQRPLVHTTDTRFIDTGNLANAEEQFTYGLEAAVISGRFHAAAEAHWLDLTRSGGFEDANFFGGSVEAGIFLTNDTRGYRGGVFKGVKVANPVGKGGLGAFQFNVRYDRLDLNDGPVIGGTQDGYMASLIWTPVNNVRFLVNYGLLDYNDVIPALANGTETDFSVNVVGARAQISF